MPGNYKLELTTAPCESMRPLAQPERWVARSWQEFIIC